MNIQKSTLHRYVQTRKQLTPSTEEHQPDPDSMRFSPNYGHSRVFTDEEEALLEEYLLTASKLQRGLSPCESMKLVYKFSQGNNKSIPEAWKSHSRAGLEWFRLFMKRHPKLSIRSPEATGLSRATSFNRHNINTFFNNLEDVQAKYHFGPEDIYN